MVSPRTPNADLRANGAQYWAFLANPRVYRIEDAVGDLEVDTWTTKGSNVAAGDRVVIWKAKGDDPVRGVVALGEVLSDPVPIPGESAYWVDPAAGRGVEDRVRLRYVLPPNLPLWLEDPANVILRELSVSRATGGTVFHVTPEQWTAVVEAAGGWPTEGAKATVSRKLLSDLTQPWAVTLALDEFDRIGREAFLARYGFGPARTYFIKRGEERYDSKAIAGAAYGYQYSGRGALRPAEFSGGEAHVKRRLDALGFEVVRVDGAPTSNPDWHRDEAILVLDLYINDLGKRLPSQKSDERIIGMSDSLRRLPIHAPELRAHNFRNLDGVYLKLANFRAIDPSTDRKGAAHVARVDREVWDEFALDPQRLRAAAEDILRRYGVRRDDPAPEVAEAEDTIAAIASGYRRAGGQGFQTSPAVRRAIEDEAMARAMAHYRRLGWHVEDVSRRASHDLYCTKPDGSETRVEVKGTTGNGSAILLTANEVEHARCFHPQVALFVVSQLVVSGMGEAVKVTGGQEWVQEVWEIDDARLRPLSFSYRLKPTELLSDQAVSVAAESSS